MTVPLIGICRHRLTTDGEGVTTLVAFHGCPLRCRYCLNPQCLKADGEWRQMDVADILDEVAIDDLYFQATNGGITFGGGEPLLRSNAIADFCQQCPTEWNIYLETSLNVAHRHLETVAPYIHHYYVDVKDMNPDIYRHYTTRSNRQVIANLRWLARQNMQGKVTIRLPHIPDYNTPHDIIQSRQLLEDMGYSQFDEFEYLTPNHN